MRLYVSVCACMCMSVRVFRKKSMFVSFAYCISLTYFVYILFNPFKPNGFFHSYYLEKSILHLRGVRLIFSSLAYHKMIFF